MRRLVPLLVLAVASSLFTVLSSAAAAPTPTRGRIDAPDVSGYPWNSIWWIVKGPRATFEWDGYSEGATYDVQALVSPMRARRRPAWETWREGITAEQGGLRVAQGQVVCVRARMHAYGSTSPWSTKQCMVRPLDDRRAVVKGRRTRVDDSRYLDERATSLRPGGRFVLRGVPRRAAYGIVATYRDALEWPQLRLAGDPLSWELSGDGLGRLMIFYRVAAKAGSGLIENRCCGPTFPIGGVVVVPRWAM